MEKKVGEVVNRLNRTREEKFPDLQAQREERDAEERRELRKRQDEEVRDNGVGGRGMKMKYVCSFHTSRGFNFLFFFFFFF